MAIWLMKTAPSTNSPRQTQACQSVSAPSRQTAPRYMIDIEGIALSQRAYRTPAFGASGEPPCRQRKPLLARPERGSMSLTWEKVDAIPGWFIFQSYCVWRALLDH